METFNPKAKEWSQQKKQLNSERKAMEDQIGELRGMFWWYNTVEPW